MQIIVVGAGITGVATALLLVRDGHEVTLIDRIQPGDEQQTSFGNAGILASGSVIPVSTPGLLGKVPKMWLDKDGPLFFNPLYLPRFLPWLLPFLRLATPEGVRKVAAGLSPLVSDAVEHHENLAKGTPAAAFIERGPYIHLYPSRAAYEADTLSWTVRREMGYTWDEMDRATLTERDPHLSDRHQFAAALHNQGWITWPAAYVAALADGFREAGGSLKIGEVVDVTPLENARAAITLAGGERLEADRTILSTGVWSGKLADKLGHKAMMQAERGYHLTLLNPTRRPPTPYMYGSAKLAITPMQPGLRVAGLAEFAPIDAPAKQTPFAQIRRRAREVYPDLEWEGETEWMGRRPSTPDSLPLVGASPKAPGIILACGGQHLGLTMGARVGQLAAGIACDRPSNIDMAPYRVDRFDHA
ncbi:FAD-binding oxidoreductase [Rhodobacteraceae bacterium NNCM2]|nr:FAD-binding oxidoreductase [Coraliihabitans acroporae]